MITDYDDVIDYLNIAEMFFANDAINSGISALYKVLCLEPDNVYALKRIKELRITDNQCFKVESADSKEKNLLHRIDDIFFKQQGKIKGNITRKSSKIKEIEEDNKFETKTESCKREILVVCGQKCLQRGYVEIAEAYFLKEIENNFSSQEAMLSLAYIARCKNKYKLSLEYLDKLLQINPRYAEAYNQKGVIFFEIGNMEKAKEFFLLATKIDPVLIEPRRHYGEVLFAMRDYGNSIATFEAILKERPDYVPTYCSLAILYIATNCFKQSLSVLEKALTIDPENVQVKGLIKKCSAQERVR